MKTELEMSPTQLETAERCMARWGFERVLGIFEDECTDPDDPAVLGTEIHRQMEVYSKTGTYPEHPTAVAFVESGHVPPPGLGEAEVPIRYRMPSGPFKGYIDDAYSVGENDLGPFKVSLGDTDDVQIVDYKTIGTKGKPKTVDELKANLAVNIYGWEAFLAGAKRVFGLWLYGQRTAPYKVTAVRFELDRSEVEAFMTKVDARAHELQRLYKLRVDPNKLPKDTSQCWAFNRRCPAFDACERPKTTVKLSRTIGTKRDLPIMTDKDFIAHVNAVTAPPVPPLPRIPPPLPPVPAAPPLPPTPSKLDVLRSELEIGEASLVSNDFSKEKVLEAAKARREADVQKNAAKIDGAFKALFDDHLEDTPVGVPEVGFVNPPGGPAVAPKTPEEAAALQGIQPPVVHDDQLEECDLATLKTIAKGLGIELPPRTRSKSYVEAIRIARAPTLAEAAKHVLPESMDEIRAEIYAEVGPEVAPGVHAEAGSVEESVFETLAGLERAGIDVDSIANDTEEPSQSDLLSAIYEAVGSELQHIATLLGATITLSWSPEKSK